MHWLLRAAIGSGLGLITLSVTASLVSGCDSDTGTSSGGSPDAAVIDSGGGANAADGGDGSPGTSSGAIPSGENCELYAQCADDSQCCPSLTCPTDGRVGSYKCQKRCLAGDDICGDELTPCCLPTHKCNHENKCTLCKDNGVPCEYAADCCSRRCSPDTKACEPAF